MTIVKRTHDELYLREDRHLEPKEYFKFLLELTRTHIKGDPNGFNILDIGCATGDLLYFLHQTFPGAYLHGIDILPPLVKVAKYKVPDANIMVGDIESNLTTDAQYDLIYMAGVHSIFDSCDKWVANIAAMLKEGGTAFVFGMFNPLPYDVLVKVRKAGSKGAYESGWNSISQETVASAFKKYGLKTRFVPWNIPIDIAKNQDDALRSWTTPLAGGKRMVSNATRVIHDYACAIITR